MDRCSYSNNIYCSVIELPPTFGAPTMWWALLGGGPSSCRRSLTMNIYRFAWNFDLRFNVWTWDLGSCPELHDCNGDAKKQSVLVLILVAAVLMAMAVSVQYPVEIMTMECRVHSPYYHNGHLFPHLKVSSSYFRGQVQALTEDCVSEQGLRGPPNTLYMQDIILLPYHKHHLWEIA